MTSSTCLNDRGVPTLCVEPRENFDGATLEFRTTACSDQVIKRDVKRSIEVKVAFGNSSPLYLDCQRVREKEGDTSLSHAFDEWSYHFAMYFHGIPVGTMTTTRCSDGPVDQEEFYPQSLLDTHRAIAFSSCKLRINHFELRGLGTFRLFTEAAWGYLADLGLRIDIMNCEVDRRGAYESVGYRCLEGFDFVHSELATVSRVMVLGADPNLSSMFRKSFQSMSNTISLAEILDGLHLRLRAPELPIGQKSN